MEAAPRTVPHLGDPTRLVALTDGVFAIIMTLLVLDLQVAHDLTESDLQRNLAHAAPTFVAYVFGFLLAGVYWIGHRELFNRVSVVTPAVLWLNIVFLLIASLIPFGAKLLGTYPESATALTLYGGLLTSLAGSRLVLYRFVTDRPRLLHTPVPPHLRRRVTQVMTLAMTVFAVCAATAGIVPPTMSLAIYGFTPVFFVGTMTWFNRNFADPSVAGNLEHIAREVEHLVEEERVLADEQKAASPH